MIRRFASSLLPSPVFLLLDRLVPLIHIPHRIRPPPPYAHSSRPIPHPSSFFVSHHHSCLPFTHSFAF
eukprot:210147-Pyramimonas_sp.AAC.1